MNRNIFKLTAIACGLALILLQINCSKNDSRVTKLQNAALKSTDSIASQKSYSLDSSKKISLADSTQRLSSNRSIQIRTGNTKEKLLTPTLIQQHSSNNTYTLSGTTTYACGAFLTDYYYGTGFYMYPAYTLDFSSTPRGSSISINVESYDVPNRFTIYDANGTYIIGTPWMGYANYSGPWGSSLNTAGNQILTFATGSTSGYSLRVETVTQDYSDSWTASIGCTAPSPQSIDFNQFAIEHNNALDYLHLNYSAGPYGLNTIYDGIVNYCNANSKPTPLLSYQQLMNLKSQVTDISSLLSALQSQHNAITNNQKSELLALYQNLSTATSDADCQTILNNFNTHISQSSYSAIEKQMLLGVSSMCFTIGDFWSSTTNFMAAPGETRNWQQRAIDDPVTGFNFSEFSKEQSEYLAMNSKGPNPGNSFENVYYRKCRFWCVLCVAFNDVVVGAAFATINPGNGIGAAMAAAVWSGFARCCICSSCGTVGCSS